MYILFEIRRGREELLATFEDEDRAIEVADALFSHSFCEKHKDRVDYKIVDFQNFTVYSTNQVLEEHTKG